MVRFENTAIAMSAREKTVVMRNAPRSRELKQIADLALFAKVVQTGGITRCAFSLGIERTTVSRRLADLERDLGVILLERTPRQVTVTDAGRRCYEECERLLDAARDAQNAATEGKSVVDPAPIVVGAPPDIFDSYLDARLSEFEARHPRVEIERYPVSVLLPDLFSAIDLMVSWERPTTSAALSTRIADVRQSIYASPDYLLRHETPSSPFDLDRHHCIVEGIGSIKTTWEFRNGSEKIRKSVTGRYVVSGLLEARETTLAGLGLSRLPNYLCNAHVEDGRLVKLLTAYRTLGRDLYIVTPKQAEAKPRATSLRIYLEDTFRTLRL